MKLFKKILMMMLALALFVGSFWSEHYFIQSVQGAVENSIEAQLSSGESFQLIRDGQTQTVEGPQTFKLSAGDRLENSQAKFLEIKFGKTGSMHLDTSTVLKVLSQNPNEAFTFEIEEGRVGVNTVFETTGVKFRVGSSTLMPSQALLDVDYHEGKLTVLSFIHHVQIQLNDPSDASRIINAFLLTQGNQVTMYDDKIRDHSETLQKLLYSKLIKEFQYGLFDTNVLNTDEWLQQNLQAFHSFRQAFINGRIKQIRDHGIVVNNLNTFGFQFNQSIALIRRVATFDHQTKIQFVVNQLLQHLQDAEYLTIVGRSDEAKQRLQYFQQLLQTNESNDDTLFQSLLRDVLEKEYVFLNFVEPSDVLFDLRNQVVDIVMTHYGSTETDLIKKFLFIRDFLNLTYEVVEQNAQVARNVLEEYYKRFVQFASAQRNNLKKLKNFLAEENQIMDNLLRQYPQFYRDHIFAMKNNLEQQWLSTIDRDEEKNEIKQTIISTKIDFLKQLQNFFLADKITVEDARQIVFRLFREADELQLSPDAQVAVSELFAKRLQDFGIFFRFLNSSEYVNTTLHGSTHQEQFQEFLHLQLAQEQVDIQDVRKEILGDSSTSSSVSADTSSNTSSDIQPNPTIEPPTTVPNDTPTISEDQSVKVPVKRKK